MLATELLATEIRLQRIIKNLEGDPADPQNPGILLQHYDLEIWFMLNEHQKDEPEVRDQWEQATKRLTSLSKGIERLHKEKIDLEHDIKKRERRAAADLAREQGEELQEIAKEPEDNIRPLPRQQRRQQRRVVK